MKKKPRDYPRHCAFHILSDVIIVKELHIRGLILSNQDASRCTHRCGSLRHAFQHHGICSDLRIVSDFYGSQNLSSGPDHDTITQVRMPFRSSAVCGAQGDSVINGAVISYGGCFSDDNAHAMVNEESSSDLR